ncbi:DUF4129 domain-containing protein [Halomicrobium salinisoli]|uniref:DUF4129 domain-containing protein n=1 Tax=Halomicrobium salinisoli TaxID=2878391 RepID=UPI001CF055D4|nr:DUF4129 domain-containing protein [Halomicrobium salinisoli]
MKRETGFRIAVAVLSIVAVGASATSIQSTVTTEASDVIDPDYDHLPIDRGQGEAISREIRESGESGDAESADSDGEDGSEADSEASDSRANEQRSDSAERSESEREQRRSDADGDQETSADGGEGPSPGLPDFFDRLVALLSDLLPALVTFVAAVAASEAVARYRDRLLAAVGPAATDPEERPAESEGGEAPGPEPSNAVERTWAELLRRLDTDRTGHMTPEEVARAAVDTGFDPEAVRALTRTFVEVRYGDRPVTEDRERAASRVRRQFDGGREVTDGGREVTDGGREVTDGGRETTDGGETR